MSQSHAQSQNGIEHDDDGWVWITCECGFRMGPYPDDEVAIDVAMNHAFDMGFAQGEVRRQ